MAQQHLVDCDDGKRIVLNDLGGSGPTLLMLHAAGFLGKVFTPMANELHGNFHCFALDIRGHGQSASAATIDGAFAAPLGFDVESQTPLPSVPSDISKLHLGRLVSDVFCAIAYLHTLSGGGTLFAFGHSLGGLLAVAAEIERPGTFAALFLFEPVHMASSSPFTKVVRSSQVLSSMAVRRRTTFPSKQEALKIWQKKIPFNHFEDSVLALYVNHGLVPIDGSEQVELACDAKRVEAYLYLIIDYLAKHCFDRLNGVTCPVAIARGTGGWPTDFLTDLMPAVADRLPRGSLITFEGLHHFGPLEAPQKLARATNTFLADSMSSLCKSASKL